MRRVPALADACARERALAIIPYRSRKRQREFGERRDDLVEGSRARSAREARSATVRYIDHRDGARQRSQRTAARCNDGLPGASSRRCIRCLANALLALNGLALPMAVHAAAVLSEPVRRVSVVTAHRRARTGRTKARDRFWTSEQLRGPKVQVALARVGKDLLFVAPAVGAREPASLCAIRLPCGARLKLSGVRFRGAESGPADVGRCDWLCAQTLGACFAVDASGTVCCR